MNRLLKSNQLTLSLQNRISIICFSRWWQVTPLWSTFSKMKPFRSGIDNSLQYSKWNTYYSAKSEDEHHLAVIITPCGWHNIIYVMISKIGMAILSLLKSTRSLIRTNKRLITNYLLSDLFHLIFYLKNKENVNYPNIIPLTTICTINFR
jgi:hypothetical protein